MSTDSDLYLRQALDCAILDRLHGVILTDRSDDIKEVLWAISNLSCQDDLTANVIAQDGIFE